MKLGTIRGINIELHYSTLLIVGLAGYSASTFFNTNFPIAELFDVILFGVISGLVILLSILAHELMHSIIAMNHGIDVEEIEFYFFGGVSKIVEDPEEGSTEIQIAIVGPLTSLGIGGVLYLLSLISWPGLITVPLLFYLGIVNLGLGLFNLLPAFPMDGGRVLRAILWKRRDNLISATRTAVKTGRVIGAIMIGWGFFQLLFAGVLGGIWMIVLGNFVRSNSTRAYTETVITENLSYLKIEQIMSDPYPVIDANLTVGDAMTQYFMNYQKQHFLVQVDGDIKGVMHLEHAQNIPPQKRQETLVKEIMQPLNNIPTIDSSSNGKEAFQAFRRSAEESDILLVMDESETEIAGFIEENNFRRAIEVMGASNAG